MPNDLVEVRGQDHSVKWFEGMQNTNDGRPTKKGEVHKKWRKGVGELVQQVEGIYCFQESERRDRNRINGKMVMQRKLHDANEQ